MKFVLLTDRDPAVILDADERAVIPAAVGARCAAMDVPGERLQGHALAAVSDTKSARIGDGEPRLSDRPVVVARPQSAGFKILERANVDEALDLASKNPAAPFGILDRSRTPEAAPEERNVCR